MYKSQIIIIIFFFYVQSSELYKLKNIDNNRYFGLLF